MKRIIALLLALLTLSFSIVACSNESSSPSNSNYSSSVGTRYNHDDDIEYVWIPRTGKKYHSSESCSGMKNPTLVTQDTAEEKGYAPCKNCY